MVAEEKRLFVGIGSPHGDDQAGWLLADLLRGQFASAGGILVRQAVVPADILDWLNGVEHLHVCDACTTGSPAATLHRWEWNVAAGDAPTAAGWPLGR